MAKSSHVAPHAWSVSDLGSFFVENRSEFLAHAKRLTSVPSEAEEIVQDSLVRVLLACPSLETQDHARAYFHKVIENLGIDLMRRQGRQPRLVVLDEVSVELEVAWQDGVDHSEIIAAAEDAAIVREALALLSPAERAALVMWEFEGRSASDIARELGVKESSVKHTLTRARAGLRRILSERIINEELGLTAVDVLSISFRKAKNVAQKSSKVALSLVLVLSAFLGFNSLVPRMVASNHVIETIPQSSEKALDSEAFSQKATASDDELEDLKSVGDSGSGVDESVQELGTSSKNSFAPYFLSIDQDGLPVGFTVSDSYGWLGQLFPGQQRTITTETGILISNIVSTKSGAVNVLLDQSIVLDVFGTSYVAQVSVGINGGWQPLILSYISSDIERLSSGNYLLNAMMVVDSAVETAVKVPTGTSGVDLVSAPEFLSIRVLLDPSKTKILAQGVYVSADSQGNGA